MGKPYIHKSSFVDDDVVVGNGTTVWHFCHIQTGARIGNGCSLGQNVNVGCNVRIGNGVRIQNNVSVYEGVEIEDDVFLGPSCVFTNVLTPRAGFPVHGKYERTVVKRGASIGANSTIVCGNTVGRYAMVGAGSVVTADVPDFALVVGVPARQMGWVCKCGKRMDERLECECGRRYENVESKIVESKNSEY